MPNKEELLDVEWWRGTVGFAGTVETLHELPGAIEQTNSLVLPLRLGLSGGSSMNVIAKLVNLDSGRFRNGEHHARTLKSYEVESAFYRRLSEESCANGARVPACLHLDWADDAKAVLLVLEDVRRNPELIDLVSGRSSDQQIALDREHAQAAVGWLARFHATFHMHRGLRASGEGELWHRGGYWTLGKRASDLDRMEAEWEKTMRHLAPVSSIFEEPGIRQLAERLGEQAAALDAHLEAVSGEAWTLLHGDFKTANLFFLPASHNADELEVRCVDFQWVGQGVGVQDLMYMLWTSVQPEVAAEEELALLQRYHAQLHAAVPAQQRSELRSWPQLLLDYRIAFLDYVRFLVGSMWGSVTPATLQRHRASINQGMHKRDLQHLERMALRADRFLAQLRAEGALPGCPAAPPPAAGGAVVQVLAASLAACPAAGMAIRSLLQEGRELQQRDKGGGLGPQTLADLVSESLLLRRLLPVAAAHPGLALVSEEGLCDAPAAAPPAVLSALQQLFPHEGPGAPAPAADARCESALRAAAASLPAWAAEAAAAEVTVWIDPLDGTRELLCGNLDGVTVLVGVCVGGRPVAGVIHQPFAGAHPDSPGRTWWGALGAGVYAGAEPLAAPPPLRPLVVATTRSCASQRVDSWAQRLAPDAVLRVGGAGSKAVAILEGSASMWVFPAPGTMRWDTCAPQALLEAAGGFLRAEDGRPYDYTAHAGPHNDRGVVAGGSSAALQLVSRCFGWPAEQAQPSEACGSSMQPRGS